jgi:hypothetical protein
MSLRADIQYYVSQHTACPRIFYACLYVASEFSIEINSSAEWEIRCTLLMLFCYELNFNL